MLESIDYHSIDIVFPFTYAIVEKAPAYTEDEKLTKVNIFYSEIVVEIYGRRCSGSGT